MGSPSSRNFQATSRITAWSRPGRSGSHALEERGSLFSHARNEDSLSFPLLVVLFIIQTLALLV